MKTKLIKFFAFAMMLIMAFALASCNTVSKEGLWEEATYRKDEEFGDGQKTVKVEVCAGDESITFTVHTDEEFLGDALLQHGLIEGEDGPYGLYVKRVNGILADYDIDASYWALSINGEYAMTGISETPVTDGEHYELTYSK
jgi:predicted small secreted protein